MKGVGTRECILGLDECVGGNCEGASLGARYLSVFVDGCAGRVHVLEDWVD